MSHFIAGEWISGNGTPFSSVDPSSGETVWSGKAATHEEIDQALHSAQKALSSWSLLPLDQRFAILKRFSELVQKNEAQFIQRISLESGKPLWDAKTEVGAMIGKIDLTLQAHHQRCESFQKNNAQTRFKPHGVIAVLGPFNFPAHLPNGQIVPALLEGNVVIFKPSEYTPGVAELTLQCWIDAGIPEGVLQLVQGERETGEYLSQHPDLNGLFFTGSSAVGQKLMELYAKTPEKILAVEMGGNNPLVVWNPCDIDAAVLGIISSSFMSAGQRCNATRRLILPDQTWGDELLRKLIERIRTVRVGSYRDDPEPFIGSLISVEAGKRALAIQESLIQKGAKALFTMKSLHPGTGLITPGVLDVTGMENEDIEIFAPLLQVYRVSTFEEALEKANQTRYGLAASLFCDEKEKFEQFWHTIRAGVIHWNHPTIASSGAAPFGGIGRSGELGRLPQGRCP
ncbi:MAG: succinylglutamate-semialdehyde dehydrogenase, partial [Verrucomicrobiota bacterium]